MAVFQSRQGEKRNADGKTLEGKGNGGEKVDMRTIHPDEDMGNADRMEPVCQVFDVGDEFIVDGDGCPEGFCQGRLSTSSDS